MSDKLIASEAIYAFCGWLTTRDETTTLSISNDSAPVAELIEQFIRANKLTLPRDGWEKKLVRPRDKHNQEKELNKYGNWVTIVKPNNH